MQLKDRRELKKLGYPDEYLHSEDNVREVICATTCTRKHSTPNYPLRPSRLPSELWRDTQGGEERGGKTIDEAHLSMGDERGRETVSGMLSL